MKWSQEIRKQLGANCTTPPQTFNRQPMTSKHKLPRWTELKMEVLRRICRFVGTRRRRGLTVPLITAALGLVIILCFYGHFMNFMVLIYKNVVIAEPEATRKETKPQPPEPFPNFVPKCERNASASNVTGFSTLPKNIQDFLFYRHCRRFPMLLNVPEKCGGPQNSFDVFLLLVIKTSPFNYERREVLRKTWAAERQQEGVWVRTVFISGTSGEGFENNKLNKLLEVEHQKYQDILQWDFKDSFYNLTLKQILFLEWMERWCPNAHFLLNGDDDIFANTDNMVEYLKTRGHDAGSKHLFEGHLIFNVGPIRQPASKYYIPEQVQQSSRYPPYCGGGGFLLSRFTARTIYSMSHDIHLLPIDDVYMGMCLEKAGLKPKSHMGVKTAGFHIPSSKMDPYDPCYYREVLLVHRFLPHQIFIMWYEIHQDDLNCGKRL